MKNLRSLTLALLCVGLAATSTVAAQDDAQALRTLRDTTIALINSLVQQGVLTRAKADELIAQAEQAGRAPGPGAAAAGAATGAAAGATAGVAGAPAAQPAPVAPGVVRVPYIPESVKQEIREEVKQDVVAKAQDEHWFQPGVLPEWVRHITWYGDVRVQYRGERFPTSGGTPNATPQELALPQNGAYVLNNTSDPVNQMRLRARFGMEARVGDTVTAGVRLVSGGVGLGTNGATDSQTLGNYNAHESVGLDLAYISYHPASWFTVTGGRVGNPFFHPTTLVWATDLSLEGLLVDFTPRLGNSVSGWAIAGMFPIQNNDPTPTNAAPSKWLYGYQAGLNWQMAPLSSLKFGVAFYDYRAVEGILNPTPYSTIYSQTAAPYRQDGNSVFDINEYANTLNGTQNYLIGLDSKFHQLNASAALDLGWEGLRPHVMIDMDYVNNIGFNHQDIYQRTGQMIQEQTKGGQVMLRVGDPNFLRRYNWQAILGYRYAQPDSVIDAFTDADFNLGGTNTQGYIIGAEFAFETNSTIRARWMSSREVSGLPLAINLIFIDATTTF